MNFLLDFESKIVEKPRGEVSVFTEYCTGLHQSNLRWHWLNSAAIGQWLKNFLRVKNMSLTENLLLLSFRHVAQLIKGT